MATFGGLCPRGADGCQSDANSMKLESHAFFAGLFHDVGKLFVLMVMDQMKERTKISPSP